MLVPGCKEEAARPEYGVVTCSAPPGGGDGQG